MSSLSFERWYPLIFAVAIGLLAFMLDASLPSNDNYRAGLLSAAISSSAILVGFVATAKSILMALPPGGIKKQLLPLENARPKQRPIPKYQRISTSYR